MLKQKIRRAACALIGILGMTAGAGAQSVQPVAHLDLEKYVGAWYQIAHYATKRDKHCVSDSIVLLTIGEKRGRYSVVTSCRTKDGTAEVHNASGKVADKLGDGKTKVSFTFPFQEKQWVLAYAPDYSWALVGSPKRKMLYILSRTPTLDSGIVDGIKAKAAANGFSPDKLIAVSQSGSQLGRPLHASQ